MKETELTEKQRRDPALSGRTGQEGFSETGIFI